MKIGIDILGGDFAPDANISGAILAQKELPRDVKLVLLGDHDSIVDDLKSRGANPDDFEYQTRIRSANDGGRWRYIADNGALCKDDTMYLSDEDHQRLCQTMIYTCDSLK